MDNRPPNELNFKRELRLAVGVSLAILLLFFLVCGAVFSTRTAPQAGGGTPTQGGYPPLEKRSLDTRRLLVLDAGHGGYDPGALSADEVYHEATLNRLVAQRLEGLLALHADELEVLKSYEEDGYTSPLARANVAADNHADLMLSLHLNASYGGHDGGFSCYPPAPGRAWHAESLRFAQMLVARAEEAGHRIVGSSGVWYSHYPRIPNGGFGKLLLDEAEAAVAAPILDEGFGVVEYAGCPSVLAEMWFISSEADMARFNNEAGYQEMAHCLYLALCDYFGFAPRA